MENKNTSSIDIMPNAKNCILLKMCPDLLGSQIKDTSISISISMFIYICIYIDG